jgi:hypothetical protein
MLKISGSKENPALSPFFFVFEPIFFLILHAYQINWLKRMKNSGSCG